MCKSVFVHALISDAAAGESLCRVTEQLIISHSAPHTVVRRRTGGRQKGEEEEEKGRGWRWREYRGEKILGCSVF